ncbi:ribbon-helix-helix protein, CopG family [Pseudobacillus badius]|uniref:ribbon-helix-helix protein, CopG family n=1 Tax=Bacillus badius TaxID=1455 RepID=UPI000596D616|nr:ribbon-helix-helix protein, CopG family [Bacillus badius]KIL73864.1 hypothetical protein SD78_2922 [Bacillus badius]UAT32947.1 ribbon-helix-helix protein, CopG family [Bacillus badius]GLY11966.1 hypothetical protein Bbad01_31820 [Bacillus badius]
MEIKVRNLNAATVKQIDELAKKKKMSREQFLRIYLEKLAHVDPFIQEKNRMEEAIQRFIIVLERMLEIVKENNEEVKMLKTLFLMITDTGNDEIDHFINTFGGDMDGKDRKNI